MSVDRICEDIGVALAFIVGVIDEFVGSERRFRSLAVEEGPGVIEALSS